MIALVEQLLVLLVFAAIGFTLAKTRIVKKEQADILSRLLVYVFLPANIIKTFAQRCTVEYISKHYVLVLVSLSAVLVLGLAAHFATKAIFRKSPDRPIYEYSAVIPNFGYLGYALTEAILGAAGLMDAMMFALPMSVYAYTVGFCILSGKRLSPKSLLNPTMISLVVGIIIGISGLGGIMPQTVYKFLDTASAPMGPVSMLLFGIVLSEFGLLTMLKERRAYVMAAIRLLAIPLCVGGILTLFAPAQVLRTAVLFFCLPCGLNTVVFVKSAGGNCAPGAALAFISTVLSLGTIPLILWIFGITI